MKFKGKRVIMAAALSAIAAANSFSVLAYADVDTKYHVQGYTSLCPNCNGLHGNYTGGGDNYNGGESVTVTITPDTGVTISSIQVIAQGGETILSRANLTGTQSVRFTMPAKNVTVRYFFVCPNSTSTSTPTPDPTPAPTPTPDPSPSWKRGDVNLDGYVNAKDATEILKIVVGHI